MATETLAMPKRELRDWIRGRSVSAVGKMASMSREQFQDVVESFGARYANGVGLGIGLLVVGQKQWPLTRDGTLFALLRKARLLKLREHACTVVMSESRFLGELGLDAYRQHTNQLYSVETLTEILDVSRERLRAWVLAGLIEPARVEHGVMFFEFQQVSAAKQLSELIQCGITVGRLRKSLEQLRVWLPEAQQPLERLSVLQDGGKLLVRLEQGDLSELDGQLRLDFSDEPTAPTMRLVPGPRTAGDWFEQGIEQEQFGYLAEAAESYRQALLVGGPDAQICFDLAGVLSQLGQKERACERYRQATEINNDFADAWNNLGMTLAELGQHDEACACFGRALAVNPNDARAHYNLADTLDDMGRTSEAAPHWKAYLSQDGQSQWAAHARRRLG